MLTGWLPTWTFPNYMESFKSTNRLLEIMESEMSKKPLRAKNIFVVFSIITAMGLGFLAGMFYERLSHPSEKLPPDISSVKILNNETFWTIQLGGMGFENGRPIDNYDIDAYITLTIYNPTEYSALLKIMGEANVSVSYEVFEGQTRSFSALCHHTENFTIPPYSQDIYKLYLLRTQKNCDVPESMSIIFSEVQVKELYREAIGS